MEEGSSNGRGPIKDPRKIARGYQLELCKKAVEENIIVYLGTGCGKTHIAVLLMYELGHLFRKPGKDVCVFLAPTVPLVRQQAVVIESSTDFKVQTYYGNSNHLKSHENWENEVQTYEVLVMTPQILVQNLRHCFIKMEHVALMIFDECHHAQLNKRHPYAQIMKEFYKSDTARHPRIFGMTASPIIGKGGSNQLNYSKCINSLEELLDSKIHAVEDKDELESVAPSPHIEVYFYQPFNMANSKLVGEYHRKLEELKNHSMSAARTCYPDLNDFKKKIKEIGRIHDNLLFCLENIGMFGAMLAARILLAEVSSDQEVGMDHGGNRCLQLQLLEQAALLQNDCFGDLATGSALEEPFYSNKLLVLIGILQKYRETSNAKCIIFVKRIIVARCLTDTLNNLNCLEFWKCEFLVGYHSGSLTRKMMNKIVERFSSGEVNLLVATNVAEEGLDIQTCGLVVRFDLPQTVSSFIQSRGRARMPESQYIFLVERGDEQAEKLLDEFQCGEGFMNREVECRTSREVFDSQYENTYTVDATGASISTGYSVPLLHRYCSSLPHDQFFNPVPKFFYLEDVNGTICRIILPSNSPVRHIDSRPCQSRDESKRVACLNACKMLHACGALNDHLLPDSRAKKSADACFEPSEDDGTKGELHEKLVPQLLSIPWSKSDDLVYLYFYDIKFIPIPEDRCYKKFGLFVKARLPEEAERMEVELHLAHGRIVNTALEPSGVLPFCKDEIILAEKFQELTLKIILDRSDYVNELVQLGTDASLDLNKKFYLLLPTFMQGHENMIDWKIVRSCLSSPVFSDKVSHSKDCGSRSTSEILILGSGAADKSDILNSLVYNPLGQVFYFIDAFLTELKGSSQMRTSKNKNLTYVEHYKLKYGFDLLYPDQPLLKAKQLFCPHNLLINRLQDNTESRELEEHFVELPPEICWMKIIAFSKDIGNSMSLLPSLLYRLENLLVAIELKNRLSESFPEASQISAHRVLEALTTERCLERFSLERLEMLGDSFLKYSVARYCFLSYAAFDEGQLTRKRSSIVSNFHLYDLAIKKSLQLYICDEMFDPSNFFALGRPCRVVCDMEAESTLLGNATGPEKRTSIKCHKLHRWLQKKTIADTVEALIGAFLVDSGFNAAIKFLKWLGIKVDYEIAHIQRIFADSEKNMSLINKINFDALEEAVGHRFQHKGLLLQAFIHPSYTKHLGGCYQRLEFLGDAVLDYLITSYLFTGYPDLKPGQLTDLRSMTVNNISFAQISVHKEFYAFVIKDSPVLTDAIDKYTMFIRMSDSESSNDEPACPKVLGDIVESCVGAVLLDSGFNLDHVWKIMLQLLDSVLAFSSFNINPTRELQELCQSCGFSDPITDKGEHVLKVDVNVKDRIFSSTIMNHNSKVARRLAALELLSKLKVCGYKHKSKTLEEIMQNTTKSHPELIGFDEKVVMVSTAELVQSAASEIMPQTNNNELMPRQRNNAELMEQFVCERDYPSTSCHDTKGSPVHVSAKSQLFEICASNYWNPPSFMCCKEEGLGHLKRFTYKVIVQVQGNPNIILECFSEPCPRKKAAEEHAAEGALWYLKKIEFN